MYFGSAFNNFGVDLFLQVSSGAVGLYGCCRVWCLVCFCEHLLLSC
jgi:hypothetical protein